MLPNINRLKKTKEIEQVFKKGKGHKEGFLFLKIAKNNLNASRFAFIVSRKVAKKAVLRNKIKRRLRELVGARLPEIKKGFDGVLVAQKNIESQNFKELKENINKLFKKARLWV